MLIQDVDYVRRMEGNIWDLESIALTQKKIAKKFFWEFQFSPELDPMLIRVHEKFRQVFSEVIRPKGYFPDFEIRYIFSLEGDTALAIKTLDGSLINVTNRIFDPEIQKEGESYKIENEPVLTLGVSIRSLHYLNKLKLVPSLIFKLRDFVEGLEENIDGIFFQKPFKHGYMEVKKENLKVMPLSFFYPSVIRFEKKVFLKKRGVIPVYIKTVKSMKRH